MRRGLAWTEEEYTQYQAQHAEVRSAATRDLSEARFLAQVRRLAHTYGWETYHTYRSDKSELGFPDLVLCNGHEVLIVELKTTRGKLTMPQQQWLSLLSHAGVETHVWRPQDWPAIAKRLTPST